MIEILYNNVLITLYSWGEDSQSAVSREEGRADGSNHAIVVERLNTNIPVKVC
tara:strand:+ start:2393 stop:2551 length:159 start_codon:yes stop_codon:yes gene_type:complete